MNRRIIGLAAIVVAVIAAAAVAANANDGRHRGKGVEYDSDIDQTCKVNIEFSEVERSEACEGKADVDQQGTTSYGRHRWGEVKYDGDIEQKCKVNIEFSEVEDSDVCRPKADIDQAGGSKGGHGGVEYDADVEQKCKVNIEFSEVEDTDVCEPKADIDQGDGDKDRDHDGDRDHDDDGKDHDDDGKDHHDDGRHHDDVDVKVVNQEKTTCEAGGVYAINQCDVGGDANTASETGADGTYENGWTRTSYESDGKWRHRGGDLSYTNQEKTTCEAYGTLAINQCDVDGDANLFSSVTRALPIGGLLGFFGFA